MISHKRNLLILNLLFVAQFAFSQYNVSFPRTVQQILPSLVKIMAETNEQFAKDMTAEVVTMSNMKIFSVGTGFFVSSHGDILTANHVVSIATGPIHVIFIVGSSVKEFEAKVVSTDTLADIALLKIQRENCPALELLDPINLPIGTELGFVGFPLGYDFPIVSKSILSAKADLPIKSNYPARHQLVLNQFINHGNSGGPVFVSETGQVIAIVSWRPSPDVQNRMIILPENYHTGVRLGGVDPIALSVETYNDNLKYIGDVAQFGLGFAPSLEYAIPWIPNKK